MYKTKPLTWAILITLVLAAVQLPFASFMADDYIQIGMLEGVPPAPWAGPFELYTIADGNPDHMRILKDAGAFQWFWQPDFKLKSFRPLSSLLLVLDHSLFGINPLGYSITNILWFLTFIIAVALLYKRFLTGSTATLAIILFTISGIHWQGMYWLASRHIIIAASLGLWSLLAYIRFREEKWQPGLPISGFGFALALLAGETGVAALAFLLTYEVFFTSGSLKEKVGKLTPFIILLITYFSLFVQ